MKNILIIIYNQHEECVGGYCELLKHHNITLLVDKYDDVYGWIPLWKKYYIFELLLTENYNIQKHKFDYVINLTSYLKNKLKIKIDMDIHHCYQKLSNDVKNITITPFPKFDYKIPYLLPISDAIPIHTPPEVCLDNKIIVYIGKMENYYVDDDTINFIKNSNYTFIFFIRKNTRQKPNILKKFKNVKLLIDTSTEKLTDIIRSATFILCRKYPYQRSQTISGAVHTGLSFNKILLLQSKMNKKYNIPSINFNKNYEEMNNCINNISLEEYNNIYKKVICFKKNSIEKNTSILNKLL